MSISERLRNLFSPSHKEAELIESYNQYFELGNPEESAEKSVKDAEVGPVIRQTVTPEASEKVHEEKDSLSLRFLLQHSVAPDGEEESGAEKMLRVYDLWKEAMSDKFDLEEHSLVTVADYARRRAEGDSRARMTSRSWEENQTPESWRELADVALQAYNMTTERQAV